ncbi:MAG: type II toxin-antitoxin system VapC family toxin [Jatrophihabitantaceae bacterium]
MIVVDSSVWINHLRDVGTPTDRRLEAMLHEEIPLAITDVVYTELLRGALTKSELARIRLRLDQTTILRMRELSDFEFAAELHHAARENGQTVRQATDCMIAAVCIREKLPLLHDDADFDKIADVSKLQVA